MVWKKLWSEVKKKFVPDQKRWFYSLYVPPPHRDTRPYREKVIDSFIARCENMGAKVSIERIVSGTQAPGFWVLMSIVGRADNIELGEWLGTRGTHRPEDVFESDSSEENTDGIHWY